MEVSRDDFEAIQYDRDKLAKEVEIYIELSVAKSKEIIKLAEQNAKMLAMLKKALNDDNVFGKIWEDIENLIAEIETKEDDNARI